MNVSPRAADRVRKVVAYGLAAGLTVLILRVLARLADGTQRLLDWEWPLAVGLAALAVLWVRAAKRVRRPDASPGGAPREGPRGGPSGGQ